MRRPFCRVRRRQSSPDWSDALGQVLVRALEPLNLITTAVSQLALCDRVAHLHARTVPMRTLTSPGPNGTAF